MTDSSRPGAGNAPELKACPWCDKSPAVVGVTFPEVLCRTEGCPLVGVFFKIEAWNTRVSSRRAGEPSPELVEALVVALGVEVIEYRRGIRDEVRRVIREVYAAQGGGAAATREGDPLREAERGLARRCVWWDGAGEDGCFYCEGEYIGDTEHVAHRKGCAVPIVRLAMIGELMVSDPAPDSTEGKHLKALVDAQEAYEKATIPLRSSQGGAASTPEGEP